MCKISGSNSRNFVEDFWGADLDRPPPEPACDGVFHMALHVERMIQSTRYRPRSGRERYIRNDISPNPERPPAAGEGSLLEAPLKAGDLAQFGILSHPMCPNPHDFYSQVVDPSFAKINVWRTLETQVTRCSHGTHNH